MTFLPMTAALILSATLLSQDSTPPAEKTSEHKPPPCVVTGRVVTAVDGIALKSTRVALVPEGHTSKKQIYSVNTDSEGRFVLKDVEQGRYEFFAMHAGYVDQHYQAKSAEKGATLSLKAGEKVSDVLFRMTQAAVITGRITNEDGEPMVRLQVVASRPPSEDELEDETRPAPRKQKLMPVSSAMTDDRGQYRIFGLKPGEYFLQVTDNFQPDWVGGVVDESYRVRESFGSEHAATYYPGVNQVSQAQSISVKAGEEAQADIPLRVVKTVEVAGRVIGPNGPAKDAWLQMQTPGEDVGVELHGSCDDKGNFRMKGVPPGSYVILAFQLNDKAGYFEVGGRQKVEVAGEDIDSLTIVVGAGAIVRGRVVIAGPETLTLSRIGLGLHSSDGEDVGANPGPVKNDGTFEITALQDGTYTLEVWGLEDNWYMKSARFGGDDVLSDGLVLEKGASSGKLEITLASTSAQVEGAVSDDDGPVVGAKVRIAPDPETPYTRFRSKHTRTDQAGHFSLTGIAPGKYRLLAKSAASSDGSSVQSAPQAVTLLENEHKTLAVKLVKPQE